MRLRQLDSLRGVFATLVVLYHFYYEDFFLADNFLVRESYLFVDFFFVLSGFVLSLNYAKDRFNAGNFKSFMGKRFRRLYPLLLFTVGISFACEFVMNVFFAQYLNNPRTVSSLLMRTLDSLAFMNSTPVFGTDAGMNYPSWSISAEMISYGIFGLVMFLSGKMRKIGFTVLILLCVAFMVFRNDYPFQGDYGFIRGLYCFSFGYFVYELFRVRKANTTKWEIPFLVVLTLALYGSNHYAQDYPLYNLIQPFLFGTGIYIFAISEGVISRVLNTKLFLNLGKWSYSIYLNHSVILIVVNVFIFRICKIPETELYIALSLLMSLACTIICSKWTFEHIEMRFNKRLKKAEVKVPQVDSLSPQPVKGVEYE